MDPEIQFHPAILKIAEALRRADQERLAHSRRRAPDDGSPSVGAVPILLAKLHHAHMTR